MLTLKNPNPAMALDELLSSEALKQLNEFGYVQFKLVNEYDDSVLGWISRKVKSIVAKEHIVISIICCAL